MARRSKPINADVPPAAAPAGAKAQPSPEPAGAKAPSSSAPARPQATPSPSAPPIKGRRQAVPPALKAIGGLVLVAVVFIGAAIVGGGGEDGSGVPGAAPAPEARPESAPQRPAVEPTTEGPEDLGYPGFATSNTTRVGGGDPASNAAAVALAVYPSQSAAQRPAAVAVVNAADWQSATAAAVLMATPVGAPLLVSEAEELPEPSAAALEALDPQGGPQSGGAQVFAIGGAAVPGGMRTSEVKATGAAGAAAIAELRERLAGRPPHHVVVAPDNPAFAVPAAAWAARSGDPVLFSRPDRLPPETVEALRRLPGTPVFVLGPSSQISSQVVRSISRLGRRVRRVSGEDPVSNAIALARYESGGFGWDVNDPGHGFVVARSDSPLDALAAAPLSASGTWGPLLLTDDADTLPPPVRDYLLDVKPGYTSDPTRAFYNHVWLIGDSEAISVGQQAEVDELAELAKIGGEP
jgi:hypothetical protein